MSKESINSLCCEFGYELLSVIPYAYHLHLQGKLENTISAYDTKCLYFFSPNHQEINAQRSWDSVKKLKSQGFPNIDIHRDQLDWDKFKSPPYKEYYSDKKITFEKETLVIFNRYNNEWGKNPINFLNIPTLDILFSMLHEKYQVVYLNLNHDSRYFDHLPPLEFNDNEILEKYPNIITFKELQEKYPDLTINEIQLRIFAGCSKYISSNGGQLILSAFFGGENIIFSRETRELDPNVNSFYGWYHKIGGGLFQHVNNYESLIDLVKQKWVDDKPLVNILIRTSHRINYFTDCVDSIYKQSYKNWNIIVGADNEESYQYAKTVRGKSIKYNYSSYNVTPIRNSENYGVPFIYNLYMNDLQNEVRDGYILYLDDDDMLSSSNSLLTIVNHIKDENSFLMWRVKFPNRLVPSDANFGKPPVVRDVDTVGFLFHHKYKQTWEPYKRGDYRVAIKLYNIIPNKIFINQTLTELQRVFEGGNGKRDDKGSVDLSIIIPTFNNVEYIEDCLSSIRKSSYGYNVEILVGIDGCKLTYNHIISNTYSQNIKFYFFDGNNGPYDIKNTLVTLTKSNKIIFFDSDDLMNLNMVEVIMDNIDRYDCIKPKFTNFDDNNNNIIKGRNEYGEGVFAIKKDLFLTMNGFEPWMCAADSDFMGRLYKRKPRILHTPDSLFKRRIHDKGLTSRQDTGLRSVLRAQYAKISKNKTGNGNPSILNTRKYNHIDNISYFLDYDVYLHNKLLAKKQEVNHNLSILLNKEPRKVVHKTETPEKIKKDIDGSALSGLLNKKMIQLPPSKIQNNPQPKTPQPQNPNSNKETLQKLFLRKTHNKSDAPYMNIGGKLGR